MRRKLRDYGSSRYVQKDDVTWVTREVSGIGQKITALISVMGYAGTTNERSLADSEI
jgi:hypothetical protein